MWRIAGSSILEQEILLYDRQQIKHENQGPKYVDKSVFILQPGALGKEDSKGSYLLVQPGKVKVPASPNSPSVQGKIHICLQTFQGGLIVCLA